MRGAMLAIIIVMAGSAALSAERPNVLFIAIDDLRNDLGCLGAKHARTPHLDALAASGRLFTHHFVQVPTCGASRCALFRGRYPTVPAHLGNNGIRSTQADWRDRSLPALFRQNGYRTYALGKITHYPGGRTGKQWAEGPEELPGVWDRCWIPETPWKTPQAMMHGYANGRPRTPGQSPPLESFDGTDRSYPDAWIADEGVKTLRELKQSDRPWFFAVGFFKPHLPFAAPRSWYDQHDAAAIPAPQVTGRPEGISGWHSSGEFRGNYGHAGRDPEHDADYARELRHAYAASVSYMDAQVGRVLQELAEQGMADDTIVIVWSDHGFLLGEHAIWGKHCLYDGALRSPLIIRTPAIAHPGQPASAVVETVDLAPTLLELCGLPVPKDLDGRSLVPQLNDPAAKGMKPAAGFWAGGARTLRTDHWRIIVHPQGKSAPAVELFDLQNDPHESKNVAAEHSDDVRELLKALEDLPEPASGQSENR